MSILNVLYKVGNKNGGNFKNFLKKTVAILNLFHKAVNKNGGNFKGFLKENSGNF